jgi:hypothetical protein
MTSLQGFFVLHSSHQTVYAEAHADDLPTWKQVHSLQLDKLANEIRSDKKDENILDANTSALAVQRKILPLDSLNLTLENERQQRLLNAIGKQKHPLIICASLLSKAPNLGGGRQNSRNLCSTFIGNIRHDIDKEGLISSNVCWGC